MKRSRSQSVFNWSNVTFLFLVHLLGFFGLIYFILQPSWKTLFLAVCWNLACSISITGGYHRLFSHPTHKAVWPLRFFYLVFGAASAQNSALCWSSDHRRHHQFTDGEGDPYSASKGFWWSHIGWVFWKNPQDFTNVRDLEEDFLVRAQHRFYHLTVALFGFVLPMTIAGVGWGDWLGGLLVACCLRLVIQYHSTFCVNSVAHMFGIQPYSTKDSSRDWWLTAIVTLGEGYHNFHHRFPNDYRNGVRWWQIDPTKWWIYILSKLRLTSNLARVPTTKIKTAKGCL